MCCMVQPDKPHHKNIYTSFANSFGEMAYCPINITIYRKCTAYSRQRHDSVIYLNTSQHKSSNKTTVYRSLRADFSLLLFLL